MKNPLKYYYLCRPSRIEATLKELNKSIKQLHPEGGHYVKEIDFDGNNGNIVDMLYELNDKVENSISCFN